MGEVLEYPDVLQENRGAMNPGRLKLSNSNVVFRNVKTGIVDQYQSTDIDEAYWLIRARGYCLKFITSDGRVHRYDGFEETDFEKLSSFLESNYNCTLQKKDVSTKGWNWGVAKFIGNSLEFEVHNHMAFEVPLNNVSQSHAQKNEVSLEFHMNDDAAVNLMEMRFHIPQDPGKPDEDTVLEFQKNVLDKADIIQARGDAIAIFEEVPCLTPRGRYDIKIYQSFLQLHGKTFDYKIPHTTILRLFLLPHKDNRQMYFVVSLDPPIKQGQTRYPFLILLFSKDEDMTIELGMSEEELQEKYEGKLQKEMSGLFYEIMSRLMKAVVNRKITVPGTFHGNSGSQSIGCSYKASAGYLYPLERGFFFVHKPPVHIRFDEIKSVNFARSAGSTRTFDFEIDTNSGVVYTFNSIEKEEYNKLYDFVSNKKLRVKNIKDRGDHLSEAMMDDMFDSDNEVGDHDAYLEQMKLEGKERDDEDEDSTDESFTPDESASSVAEEYDSNVSSSEGPDTDDVDSGDSDAKQKKRERKEEAKRKKKEKRKRSEKKARKSRKKAKKDPNAPKRPQSAYFIWLNEHREHLKEEYPGISVTELSKRAGEKWRTIRDKTEWEEKAKEARLHYEEKLAEYKKTLMEQGSESEESGAEEGGETKKKKSPSKKDHTKAGSGAGYKSKEFISEDSDSDSGTTKPKKKRKKEKEEKRESEEKMEEGSGGEKSDDQKSGGEEEKSGAEEEKSGAEEEKSGAEEEKSGVEEEKSGAEEEKSGVDEEKSGAEEEKSGAEKSASDAGKSGSEAEPDLMSL